MHQEQVVRKSDENWAVDLLASLKDVVFAVDLDETGYAPDILLDCIDRIAGSFQKDYDKVAEIVDLLFGPHVAAYGDQAASVFARWDEEGDGPSIASLLALAAERFHLDIDRPEMPPKPKSPAIIARTRNVKAHCSILSSLLLVTYVLPT